MFTILSIKNVEPKMLLALFLALNIIWGLLIITRSLIWWFQKNKASWGEYVFWRDELGFSLSSLMTAFFTTFNFMALVILLTFWIHSIL